MTPKQVEEIFLNARDAMRGLEALKVRREQMANTLHGGIPMAINSGTKSDPTGSTGTKIADMAPDWDAQEEAMRGQVRDCASLCVGIGTALGVETGLTMEYHYLWDMPWKQVATSVGRSVTNCKVMRSTALEYVAEVGPAAAREGTGRAEE